MKKILLMCGMVIALSATVASAGVNIGWNECLGGGGVRAKTFACNVNTGSSTLYASAMAPPGIGLWTGFAVEMYIGFTGEQPAWWQLRNQGTQINQCRHGALIAQADFLANVGCADPYQGQGAGGIATYQNLGNRARLLLAFAVAAGSEVPLDAGVEYYAAKVLITNAKTVGTGFCAGCDLPACINLTSVKFVQPAGAPGGDVDVTTEESFNSNTAVWQELGDTACPGLPTPATRATWGSVKSLYR